MKKLSLLVVFAGVLLMTSCDTPADTSTSSNKMNCGKVTGRGTNSSGAYFVYVNNFPWAVTYSVYSNARVGDNGCYGD